MDKRIKTSFFNSENIPLVIEPSNPSVSLDDLLSILQQDNDIFKKKMLEHGGLFFRSFSINTVDDFVAVMKALNTGEFVDYTGGGSPRSKIQGSVYTSTEAPPAIKIHLHNELSFSDNYPGHIYFYCDIPPEHRGETFIGDARKICQSMDKQVRKKFIEKGIKYTSRYYYKSKLMDFINSIQRGHKTWIDVFETDDKEDVERKCSENNIGFKWNQNDWLEISRLRPASIVHPETKETVWFNQVHQFDHHPRIIGWWRHIAMKLFYCRQYMKVDDVCFADNEKISGKEMNHVIDVLDKHSLYFPWKKGDVMVLDNILTMHGRAPFKGKRRVLTAMTK
ncbi:MAG: TauD/TfdA family dioxygenase [Waddliaceae bacterium]